MRLNDADRSMKYSYHTCGYIYIYICVYIYIYIHTYLYNWSRTYWYARPQDKISTPPSRRLRDVFWAKF